MTWYSPFHPCMNPLCDKITSQGQYRSFKIRITWEISQNWKIMADILDLTWIFLQQTLSLLIDWLT